MKRGPESRSPGPCRIMPNRASRAGSGLDIQLGADALGGQAVDAGHVLLHLLALVEAAVAADAMVA